MKFERRKLILPTIGIALASGGVTFAVTYGAESGDYDARSPFIKLGLDAYTPDDVTETFLSANSALLMASYSVFFPKYLAEYGYNSVKLLHNACKRKKSDVAARQFAVHKNAHRLDVLPSICAVHYLHNEADPKIRVELKNIILKSLRDGNRQVKEIIFQNLINSSFSIDKSPEKLIISEEILDIIRSILYDYQKNSHLIILACFAVEHLLNSYVTIKNNSYYGMLKFKIEEIFKFIEQSKTSELWYIKELIRVYLLTFGENYDGVNFVPLQSSEALMGWRKYPYQRRYMQILSLIRARNLFNSYKVSERIMEESIHLSRSTAKRSIQKTSSMFKSFEFDALIKDDMLINKITGIEESFSKFLSHEFNKVIFHNKYNDIDDQYKLLGSLVPHRQFQDISYLENIKMEHGQKISRSSRIAFANGISTILGIAALDVGMHVYSSENVQKNEFNRLLSLSKTDAKNNSSTVNTHISRRKLLKLYRFR